MATKKPTTTKKTPSKSKAATATKKAPAKKAAPAKAKTKKPAPVQSFRMSRETEKFISSRITIQTFYWLIMGVAILIMGLLVLKAQLDILDTLDQISEGF